MTPTPETADIAGLVERYISRARELSDGGKLTWWSGLADLLQSLSAELAEAKREIIRLRKLLRDDPKTILIAYEDGDHMRLSRAAAKAEDRATTAEAQARAMREALTPSGDTKAAYMGKFSMRFPDVDEDGNEYAREINIPWTTIKEIMAAIKVRALGGSNAE